MELPSSLKLTYPLWAFISKEGKNMSNQPTFRVAGRIARRSQALAHVIDQYLSDGQDAQTIFDAACEQSSFGYTMRDSIEENSNVTIRHANEEQF